MNAVRTERVTVNLTPEVAERLDRLAGRNRWTRSTAAAILIELALERGIEHAEPVSEGGDVTRLRLKDDQ